MSEWQPIETAPKDGTPIFITAPYWLEDGKFRGALPIAVRWTTNAESGANWEGGGWWTLPDLSAVVSNAGRCTHWMPLPFPPTSAISESK
jgi:hypothetical protein